MKKILTILSIIILTGCNTLDISNTPTKKVEEFLKENFKGYKQKIAILNNSDTPHVENLISFSKDIFE